MTRTHLARSMPWLSGLFVTAAAVVAVAPMASAGGKSATPKFLGTKDFVYTGAPEDWTVPAGITSITALVCGASGENMLLGGTSTKFAGRPGHGGCVGADVRVAPGDVIHVRVGGHATTSAGGWPDGGLMTCPGIICGGGGGASSDIRIGGDTLADRVLVGGGGGGGGGGALGGSGGNAGGGTGTIGFNGERGAAGMGMVDTAALVDTMGGGGGGLAQTFNGGCGISGTNGLTPSCSHTVWTTWAFPSGKSGVANKGADSAYAGDQVGGAGGGGYFGGGSGCGYTNFGQTNLGACGGGGGSSYADPTRTADHFLQQGTTNWYTDWLAGQTVSGDNGTITFSWPGAEVPVTTTTVAATTTTTLPPTTTTIAATTTTAATTTAAPTTTTIDLVLPATGSEGSTLPFALALFGLGITFAVIARRRMA
jgi:LPXTG-motif cell wall-anchored protein